MWELIKAGGWLMVPIILCSVLALAIILERLWVLRRNVVAPPDLGERVLRWVRKGSIDERRLSALREDSPLGRILAAGCERLGEGSDRIKEGIEDAGRHEVHVLERYLNTLGTIAAIAPLLGLLGTVFGMIHIFSVIVHGGAGDASRLAGGISQALITTAAGLIVAIPALIFYRYLRGRVEDMVVEMERQTIHLLQRLRRMDKAPRRGTARAVRSATAAAGKATAAPARARRTVSS